jgi:ketosteroid isomerase-like protein
MKEFQNVKIIEMKPNTILFVALILTGLLAIACSDATDSDRSEESIKETFDLNAMEKIIKEKTDLFTEAHITKDTTFLNNIFTKDARSFPPNAEAVVGRKAIAQLNADWVNFGIYEAKEISTSFYGTKDYLIDEGTYTFIYGEDKTTDKGKYINIWKMEDGEWKIDSNIWNSSLPE